MFNLGGLSHSLGGSTMCEAPNYAAITFAVYDSADKAKFDLGQYKNSAFAVGQDSHGLWLFVASRVSGRSDPNIMDTLSPLQSFGFSIDQV